MKTVLLKKPVLQMKPWIILATSGIIELMHIKFFPSLVLIQWVLCSLILDLISAFIRAVVLKEGQRIKRLHATMLRIAVYFIFLLAVVIVENVFGVVKSGPMQNMLINYLNNVILFSMIIVEAMTILENLIVLDPKNPFTMYILIPVYRLLTWQIKGNIINKISPVEPKEQRR